MTESPVLTRLRRRDLLRGGVLLGLGLVGLRLGLGYGLGPRAPAIARDPARLRHLSARQEAIVTAVAQVMLGELGRSLYASGAWDVAADTDRLLGGLAADQRRMLGLGMELLEGWSLSPKGFSTRDLAEQEAWLEAWRDGNPVQRGVWGFLHSAVCASFAGGVGWAHMGYPGPCLPGPSGPGRPPGQTALFTWDEVVP